jgi:hypothetical protein
MTVIGTFLALSCDGGPARSSPSIIGLDHQTGRGACPEPSGGGTVISACIAFGILPPSSLSPEPSSAYLSRLQKSSAENPKGRLSAASFNFSNVACWPISEVAAPPHEVWRHAGPHLLTLSSSHFGPKRAL